MLKVQGLQKSFDKFAAVSDANLTVERGQVVAVIGPNGAGKTTLFKLITGQLRPDAGRVVFKGEDIAGLPAHRVTRKGLSLSFQVVNVFARLTVFDNVQVAVMARRGQARNLWRPAAGMDSAEVTAILDSVGLGGKAGRLAGELSHGDGKVLELAVALGNKPEMLIMDEPTAGMSPEETRATIGLIRRLTGEMGLTILLCEHDMELVFAVADEIMVMRQGATITQGVCDDVRCNEEVQRAYLGEGA